MLIKIKEGISLKLSQGFGEGYKIYTNKIEQDFIKPCFYIKVIESANTQMSTRKYKRINSVDIQYFPSLNGGNDETYPIIEQLFEWLEYIPFENDLVRATDMKFKTVDNEFHFLVNYNMDILKNPDIQEYMENLKVDTGVKEYDN
jgi:hypothetical protein